MDIAKHISYLLQFHECVIIPEFGGFISNYKPAQFDAVKQMFNPPSKEMIFNTKINRNDGLLINHLIEVEELGYHQAQTAVLNFVDQLYRTLERGEKVHFSELGSFGYDRSGNVIFTAQSKFDLIDAYGLKPISYPSLHQTERITNFRPRPAVRAINNRKDIIKIAASITLLFALSLFPLKNDKVQFQSSNLNPISLLINDQPNSFDQTIKEVNTLHVDNMLVKGNKNSAPFILVGGSFQQFDNANELQRELTVKGHNAEIIEQDNGFFRVVIDSYNSKENALLAMKSYRSDHLGSNVWVSIR